jgi:hypothetical protein
MNSHLQIDDILKTIMVFLKLTPSILILLNECLESQFFHFDKI